jgi:uncharacterized membrane-anchored protein/uncharacterized integral membrane protein
LAGSQTPPDAEEPAPWLIAMLMVGALLCCGSALGLLVLLLEEWVEAPSGYLLALVLWAAAVGVLHRPLALFAHCLAVVGVGTGSIWMGVLLVNELYRRDSVSWLMAGLLQAALMAVSAGMTRPRWVRQWMGVAAAAWLVIGVLASLGGNLDHWPNVLGAAAMLALALAWSLCMVREPHWAGRRDGGTWAAFADGMGMGLLVAVVVLSQLGTLAMQLLAQAEQPLDVGVLAGQALVSAVLVLAFGVALLRRWRQAMPGDGAWSAPAWIAVLLAALASVVMPWMAPVALIAAACAMSGRWRMLTAGGVAALCVLGRFYYDLSWPLATKGLALAGMGAVLAVLLMAVRGRLRLAPGARPDAAPSTAPRARLLPAGVIAVAALLGLGLVNHDVWRKENVVRHGEAVLVPLMPVDPRSLMQGDYMDLRFDIPEPVTAALDGSVENTLRGRAFVVVALDERHQATVLRMAGPGEPLAANERLMPLKRLKGRWTLVTDAYFFPEGGSKPFEAARFGEFRVLPDGRALLVGLSDAQGRPIRAPADLRD